MDNEADDLEVTPGFYELAKAESLLDDLQRMRQDHGRLWAIAATDAEKLVAWISYAVSTFDAENSPVPEVDDGATLERDKDRRF